MKKCILVCLVSLCSMVSFSQELTWTPSFPTESTASFTITLDASKGNQGLLNYTPTTDVYVHIGVITNLSTSSADWKYVKFTWATTNPAAQCVSAGTNKWSYTITGGLRTFFGISNPAETIQKISILFRNGAGSKVQRNTDGSDMYIPIYTTALAARFSAPPIQPMYVPQPEPISLSAGAVLPTTGISNNPATLKLYLNRTLLNTATSATTVSAFPGVIAGNDTLVLEANDGTTIKTDTIKFFVASSTTVAALPAGVRDGINYDPANNTVATLVLYAPGKTRVCVIGDIPASGWAEQAQYQMSKTPDGNYWWVKITGLTPGTEYSFQYLVDGTLKIAEPYAEKILDPYNDQYIASSTYPGLKAYPTGSTTGVVSELQTGTTPYTWAVPNFTRPDKRSLTIYELLVRDFVGNHDWNTLRDTLNYLKNLGVNAIELMPVNEFEGNLSWGYNPDFYFTPDKYYGPANDLKRLVDSCHKRGIAVIMDIALNHSFGMAPMVQLYWDAANSRPAANNPWFNPVAKHAYNVGYDMNHESLATRYFVSRVVEHWLTNYKMDGFRFDLSKGFTQTQTCDNNGANCDVAGWGNYDASRIAIWKRYYDSIQLKSSGAYCILEHFAANSEELELSNYGMMPWGNMNYAYNQATMGFSTGWDLSQGIYSARGWSQPNLVTYMESHDEERLMYKNLQFGNSSGTYNIKTLTTALQRQELAGAFFFTLPGPKMIWQFGELGYDYSINYCSNGTINNSCRTDSKPLRWDYLTVAARRHLFQVDSLLIRLRTNTYFKNLFTAGTLSYNLANAFKSISLSSGGRGLVSIGNFDVVNQTGSVTFPYAGTWYDYITSATVTATGGSQSFTLLPGEYHVYINMNPALPVTLLSFSGKKEGSANVLKWETANEVNLACYTLERSTDGKSFSAISKLAANNAGSYQYTDTRLDNSTPAYYYRLKTIDNDGKSAYSQVVRIRAAASFLAEVAPNPVTDAVRMTIESPVSGTVQLSLTDMSGRQVISKVLSVSAGTNAVTIPGTEKLGKGVYMLTVENSGEKNTLKIVKN